jgi:hypothetical protein
MKSKGKRTMFKQLGAEWIEKLAFRAASARVVLYIVGAFAFTAFLLMTCFNDLAPETIHNALYHPSVDRWVRIHYKPIISYREYGGRPTVAAENIGFPVIVGPAKRTLFVTCNSDQLLQDYRAQVQYNSRTTPPMMPRYTSMSDAMMEMMSTGQDPHDVLVHHQGEITFRPRMSLWYVTRFYLGYRKTKHGYLAVDTRSCTVQQGAFCMGYWDVKPPLR